MHKTNTDNEVKEFVSVFTQHYGVSEDVLVGEGIFPIHFSPKTPHFIQILA